MKVVSFHNEVILLSDLQSDTLHLIRHTEVVRAIKTLVAAHDIIDLALTLEKQYEEFKWQPPWNKATSHDLDLIRVELVTSFSDAFTPPYLLPKYYSKVGKLIQTMSLRERDLHD